MKSLFFAGAILVGLLASGAAWADIECNVPVAHWQPREVLRQQLEQQGLQVQRVKVDDGCYEVRGVDANGKRFKAKYAPDSLKVIEMKTKDDEYGETRRDRDRDRDSR